MLGSDTDIGGMTPANTDEEQSDKNTTELILNLEIVFIFKPSDKAKCSYRADKHHQNKQYLVDITESIRLLSFKTCTLHAKTYKSLFFRIDR